jgi:hypothetical protein
MTTDPSEHVSADELADAANPDVGTGTPETAPYESPAVSFLRRYPVALFGLVLLLPSITAAVTAWTAGATAEAIVATAISALIAGLTPLVHAAVTPIAAPRLDAETPLGVVNPR